MKEKKNNKIIAGLCMALALFLCLSCGSYVNAAEDDGNWSSYQNSETNNGVTSRPGPTDAAHVISQWTDVNLGGHTTPPIIVGDYLYTACNKSLYRLDKETGEVLETRALNGNAGYALNPVVYAEGKIFVTIVKDNGTAVDAFEETSLDRCWTSTSVTGQFASPLTYHKIGSNGYLYTGTWSNTDDGRYFCVSINDDGKVIWTKESTDDTTVNGFWWDGAYATDNYVAFASENGIGPEDGNDGAYLYTVNSINGNQIDAFPLKGSVRNTIVFYENYLYVGTAAGRLYRIHVDANGNLAGENDTDYSYVDLGGPIKASVVINDGRAYVGVEKGNNSSAKYVVLDSSTFTEKASVNVDNNPKGAPILSTAVEGKDYIYFTCNYFPGALYYFTYTEADGCSQPEKLFTPSSAQEEYCISSLAIDTDGTIYYTNDSKYIFAIAPKLIESIEIKESGVNWIDEAFNAGTSEYNLMAGTDVNMLTFNVKKIAGDTEEIKVNGISQSKVTVPLTGESTTVEIAVSRNHLSATYKFNITKVTEDNTSLGLLYYGTYPQTNLLGDIVAKKSDYIVDLTKTTETKNKEYSLLIEPLNSGATVEVYAAGNVKDKITGRTYSDGSLIDASYGSSANDYHTEYPVVLADYSKNMKLRIKVTAKDKVQEYSILFDRGNAGTVKPVTPGNGSTGSTVSKPVTSQTATQGTNVATPKKVSGVKVKKKKNKLTITWKKVSKTSGYQILIAKDKKFKKNKKTITIKKGITVKKSLKYLKTMKYLKIRAYNKGNGKTVYGAYSKIVKIK